MSLDEAPRRPLGAAGYDGLDERGVVGVGHVGIGGAISYRRHR
jgi:hypothetical protein